MFHGQINIFTQGAYYLRRKAYSAFYSEFKSAIQAVKRGAVMVWACSLRQYTDNLLLFKKYQKFHSLLKS